MTGKRAGARRGASSPPRFSRVALGICAGITLCVVAWGYLVYAAIDFGTAARSGGAGSTWALMALASLGAIACLFAGLLLGARLMRVLAAPTSSASSGPSASSHSNAPAGPRPPGGKRAAR